MKNIKLIALMSLFAVSCKTDGNEYQDTKDINFLALSDVQFSPYSLCDKESAAGKLNSNESKCVSLMGDLHKAEASDWDKIFEKYLAAEKGADHKEGTNFNLYKQFLAQLESVATSENIDFVVILGNLLSNDFHAKLKKYSKLTNNQDIELFTKKTFEYLSISINSKLAKNVEVYPVLGQNDSYVTANNVDNPANSNLYKDLSVIWKGKAQGFETSDSFNKEGGYYHIELTKNNQKLNIVGLNSNMFTRNTHSVDNIDIDALAKTQLNWLINLFKGTKKPENKETKPENAAKNKYLIISNSPNGIDPFATSNKQDNSVVSYWKNKANEAAYVKTLSENASDIVGVIVGQTHHDGFQIIDSAKNLASSSVPALNPTRNNPGFKVFKLNKDNILVNSTTHYYDLANAKWSDKPIIFTDNNLSSANLAHGYGLIVENWHKDVKVIDKNFLKRFVLNTDAAHLEPNWKHFICASSDGMSEKEYSACLKKVTEKNN